ncbi:hypothetical protein [Edaphocola aurantiacus]|uniref:hypothetical protein n=1 Tax=Edaphocola aurantiacus TaxID=2601682 RepID=UPI001C98715A|nr:hypothetical protein [Edaphocola aurantiacus]
MSNTWIANEGDLAGGMIFIALYSSKLWSPTNNNNNPGGLEAPPSITAIVQADCIGYLYGWGKAWLWDELPTPKERMKAGLGTALEFSLMKRLAKYL